METRRKFSKLSTDVGAIVLSSEFDSGLHASVIKYKSASSEASAASNCKSPSTCFLRHVKFYIDHLFQYCM